MKIKSEIKLNINQTKLILNILAFIIYAYLIFPFVTLIIWLLLIQIFLNMIVFSDKLRSIKEEIFQTVLGTISFITIPILLCSNITLNNKKSNLNLVKIEAYSSTNKAYAYFKDTNLTNVCEFDVSDDRDIKFIDINSQNLTNFKLLKNEILDISVLNYIDNKFFNAEIRDKEKYYRCILKIGSKEFESNKIEIEE